ncbi:MAG: hypothetical protein M0P31_12330 [Solirubrobacteraceae bacterium]|nr:hypothetical protein [Solirubrobacteraceae bacterium]
MHHSLSARVATAFAVVALPLVALPATSAQAASVSAPQACHFDADDYWRSMPVTITGDLVDDVSGAPVASAITPGTKVRLKDPTVDVSLSHWDDMFQYAYDAGYIHEGAGQLPIDGWIALEGVNTAEGVTGPIAFSTVADTFGAFGNSSATFVPPAIDDVVWTAAGGSLRVRQAPATTMGPIPVGRVNDAPITVNGTLFIRMVMDDGLRVRVDCQSGGSLDNGATHTTEPPVTLGSVRVPGYAGDVDGADLADPVDADVDNETLPRAAAGVARTVTNTTVRVRLDATQAAAWLGVGGTVPVTASFDVHGARSVQGSRTVTSDPIDVEVAGGAQTVEIPVSVGEWTPTGDDGVDLRADDRITLTADVAGTIRTLTLDRDTSVRPANQGYPFARIVGPDPRSDDEAAGGGGGTPTTPTLTPPPIDGGGDGDGFRPPPSGTPTPVDTPKATAKTRSVQISSGSLRRKNGRVSLKLLNRIKGATSGKYRIVTRSKYRVGKSKKAKRITVVAYKKFKLKSRRSATFKPRLSKAATQLLRTRKSVKVTITVVPTKAKTQATTTKRVTLRR